MKIAVLETVASLPDFQSFASELLSDNLKHLVSPLKEHGKPPPAHPAPCRALHSAGGPGPPHPFEVYWL